MTFDFRHVFALPRLTLSAPVSHPTPPRPHSTPYTPPPDLHALVEELEDVAVSDEALDLGLQPLREPTQQVEGDDHEVLVGRLKLVGARHVRLQHSQRYTTAPTTQPAIHSTYAGPQNCHDTATVRARHCAIKMIIFAFKYCFI